MLIYWRVNPINYIDHWEDWAIPKKKLGRWEEIGRPMINS